MSLRKTGPGPGRVAMNPHRRFMLLLAAALIGGVVALSFVVSSLLERYTYAETDRMTRDGTNLLFATELPPDIFDRPLSADAYARVYPVVRSQLQVYNVVQARFYRPDRTVTFSFTPAQVGGGQPAGDSPDDLIDALAGRTSLDVRSLPAADNLTGTDRPHILEVYVPVRRDGAIIGVAEVYRDISDVLAAVRRMQLVVVATVSAGAFALFVGLTGIYRQSTATIQRQAGELRSVLDAAGEGMALLAIDGRVLWANRRFEALFVLAGEGYTGQVLGGPRLPFRRWFADPATAALLLGLSRDGARAYTGDVTQQWPEPRELELSSVPVPGASGAPLGRLLTFRDVTRERAVDRMKTEFVALVSHELRTPLTSIKGYVDLLVAGDVGPLSREQRDFLGVVKRNADREVALVNDLLDVARLDAGEFGMVRAPVDLAPLIAEVARSFRPEFEAKAQRLALELGAALPPVWGNAAGLTRIVANLVSNAHKYTPAGGQVCVTVAVAAEMVRVDVRDTGIGLSPEEQAQAFTRFYRARNRATEEAGGTGLGLAITRSLVELHGGRITVASSPGQGATFSVTLPAVTEGTVVATGETAASPPARPQGA